MGRRVASPATSGGYNASSSKEDGLPACPTVRQSPGSAHGRLIILATQGMIGRQGRTEIQKKEGKE